MELKLRAHIGPLMLAFNLKNPSDNLLMGDPIDNLLMSMHMHVGFLAILLWL